MPQNDFSSSTNRPNFKSFSHRQTNNFLFRLFRFKMSAEATTTNKEPFLTSMHWPAAFTHPVSFVLTKHISSMLPGYSLPICHTSPSRLNQIAQGIESSFDKQGGLDAAKLSAPIWSHFFLVWWNFISTWLALLDTAQTRTWLHLPTSTYIQLHYKALAHTMKMHTPFHPRLCFHFRVPIKHSYNNLLLDFQQQHLFLPACLFLFLLYNILV